MEPDENDPIDEPSDCDELDYYGNHPDNWLKDGQKSGLNMSRFPPFHSEASFT